MLNIHLEQIAYVQFHISKWRHDVRLRRCRQLGGALAYSVCACAPHVAGVELRHCCRPRACTTLPP